MKKGNGVLEGIVILAVFLVLFVARLGDKSDSEKSPVSSQKETAVKTQNISASNSQDFPNISLSAGNASRSYQSFEEYITIDNRGKSPASITNWYLKNGKDKRAYDIGGQLKYFPADTATIGQGVIFISPSGHNIFQNIVLEPGEKAVITTGSVGSQTPYKIVSFKENICSGYLQSLEEYTFTPQLTQNCPKPRNELGEICSNCVNGKPLSSACVAFVKSHFSYDGCIANHVNDKNFSGTTWRVFLNHGWEMWAKEYETIELFDQFGRLVKSRSY